MVTLLELPKHIMLKKENYCMLTFLGVGVADKKKVFLHRILSPWAPLVLGPPWLVDSAMLRSVTKNLL